MTADPHGWLNFWDLYRSGRWEPQTHQLIREVLRPGVLFVDVGAWIGPTTLWALETGAAVIAIEPDPVALPELREQIRSRNLGHRVEVWECAIGAQSGSGTLQANPKDGGEYGDSMSRLGTEGVLVDVFTLPQLLGGRRPDLVKIDIEGGEVALWDTLVPWLGAQAVPLQLSCHGTLPDRALFDGAGYGQVYWTADTWGDIVALPNPPRS